MLPVDAPEVYLRNDAVCESQLLSVILKNDPTLFVTILDVCQIVPSKYLKLDFVIGIFQKYCD